MPDRIAILGSAPSSVALTPFDDPSWTIWCCSPGAWPHAKRADAWFELHRRELDKPWFSAEYIHFLQTKVQGPVYVAEPWPELPNALVVDPLEFMDAIYGYRVDDDGIKHPMTFGPYLWGSTLSFMMAMAIMAKPKEIGVWGVDMSADEEWQSQRDTFQQLIWIAKQCGIKVTIPPESDVLRPAAPYGFREVDPMHIKLLARQAELTVRVNGLDQQLQQITQERMFCAGALSNVNYTIKTWLAQGKQLEMAYWNPGEEIAQMAPMPEATAAPAEEPVALPKLETFGNATLKPARKAKANGTHIQA